MKNYADLSEIFVQLSELELKRGRIYPSRAFLKSGKVIENSINHEVRGNTVFMISNSNEVTKLGDSSSKIVIDYFNDIPCLRLINLKIELGIKESNDKLRNELLRISGIGEVKVDKILSSDYYLDFTDFINKLPNIGGIIGKSGIKFTQMMRTGIEILRLTSGNRLPWIDANKLANSIIYSVANQVNYDYYVHKLGSLRRHKNTVGDIDLVVSNCDESHFPELRRLFSEELDHLLVSGESKIAGIKNGFQVDIRFLPTKFLGAMILHGTGSSKMNILMRSHAKSLGYRLNEYGVFDNHGVFHTFSTEEEVFEFLGVKYIPPKYRSDVYKLQLIGEN